MATLHDKLKALGPVPFASLPSEQEDLRKYLQEHFEAAQFIIESIPQPAAIPTTSERRARATSSASTLSDISHSEARSETPSSEHEKLQKDWGRPIKLSEKENPVGVSVYKLSAKDGKGAWFARRSVHEGLSFDRWKEGLMQEFPTSLAVEGGPGSGKIRGIAADTRAVQLSVEDSGKMEGKGNPAFSRRGLETSNNSSVLSLCSIPWAIGPTRLRDASPDFGLCARERWSEALHGYF